MGKFVTIFFCLIRMISLFRRASLASCKPKYMSSSVIPRERSVRLALQQKAETVILPTLQTLRTRWTWTPHFSINTGDCAKSCKWRLYFPVETAPGMEAFSASSPLFLGAGMRVEPCLPISSMNHGARATRNATIAPLS